MTSDLHHLGQRLIGTWTTTATHPALPDAVLTGSTDVEWLDGQRFLIIRSHCDHPDIPDAISILGDTTGLHMHYFDSRGVHRLFELTVTDDGWTVMMNRHAPAGSFASTDAPFSQRTTYSIADGDQMISVRVQLSHDDLNWDDDLKATYVRVS